LWFSLKAKNSVELLRLRISKPYKEAHTIPYIWDGQALRIDIPFFAGVTDERPIHSCPVKLKNSVEILIRVSSIRSNVSAIGGRLDVRGYWGEDYRERRTVGFLTVLS
jgi:hypothetical protein